MLEEATYEIPGDVLAAHLEGEAVLLQMESKRYYRLNGTGAFIWKRLEQGLAAAEIVAEICEAFEVERDAATEELERLLADLRQQGLLAAPPGAADGR